MLKIESVILPFKLFYRTDLKKNFRIARGLISSGVGSFRLARKAITEKQAVQRTWELMSLIGLVQSLRPDVIMEIGTHNGGTLFCWAQLATDSATIISLDLPGGAFGGGYRQEDIARFESYLKTHQTLKCLPRDSHLAETYCEVVNVLSGRQVDFLFIDGDHTYEGVKADFNNYAGLVRRGGLVAFHDIHLNPDMPECQVHRFWQEIKHSYEYREFIDQNGPGQYGMGIGVLTL